MKYIPPISLSTTLWNRIG